jgi:hypothetical protein
LEGIYSLELTLLVIFKDQLSVMEKPIMEDAYTFHLKLLLKSMELLSKIATLRNMEVPFILKLVMM